MPGICAIGLNFDETAGVVPRVKQHKWTNCDGDELFMMDDLRHVNPFQLHEGRSHQEFKNIPKSQVQKLDGYKFQKWLRNINIILGHKYVM